MIVRKEIKKGGFLLFAILFVLLLGMQKENVWAQEETELNIYGIYLGGDEKGDATLLESRGRGLLIDIGAESQTDAVIKQLKKIGMTHVDVLFSHLHSDHMGSTSNNICAGLENLEAKGISVDTLYVPSTSLALYSERISYRAAKLQSYVNQRPNTQIVYLNVGDRVQVGDAVGKVIGPTDSQTRSPYQYTEYSLLENRNIIYENDSSLAMIFTCGNTRFFTAGDCYGREAKSLVDTYGNELKCDIMKLNHHGIGTGNSADLINAISPKYSFVPNSGVDLYSEKSGRWRTYTATKRASKYGMCYMIGNEEKTIIYHIENDNIELYKGSEVSEDKKMTGWQYLYGADGDNRDHDMYYLTEDCEMVTGVKKIGTHYYYFSVSGQMDYGKYSSSGKYSGWKSYGNGKRHYTLSENEKYAYMNHGFKSINHILRYFDKNGYLVTSGIEDETTIKKLGSYYYAINGDGEITVDDWEEIDDFTYYFDKNGRMIRNQKYQIDGELYLFDMDGSMYVASSGTELVDFGSNTYAVRTDGTLVTNKIGKIDGEKYYFNSTGIVQKNKMIQIHKKLYFFDKNGKMVHSRTFNYQGKKYHSDKNGVVKLKKAKKSKKK